MTALYTVNFTTANNADLRQSFTLNASDGNPIDLTGAVLKMDFENRATNDVLVANQSNGFLSILDEPAGQFELAVPAAILSAINPGVYKHDLIITLANNETYRVWQGALSLTHGVTQ